MREITVCSWLPLVGLRGERVADRCRLQFADQRRSSVWSRSVTTEPSRRPAQRAGGWFTTTIRSAVR